MNYTNDRQSQGILKNNDFFREALTSEILKHLYTR